MSAVVTRCRSKRFQCRPLARLVCGTGAAALLLVFQPGITGAEIDPNEPPSATLKRLTLEQLLELPVTSPSRRPERFAGTAAALDVITSDLIQNSGAANIPEALRLATGVHVARTGSAGWAISARGFNLTTANKLQVLMDGRSLYTPLFSGVFWDVQDTLMEDLDRIEVIRGPAGATWGANAVNGVINIMTRSADQTQGWLVTGGGGTEERAFGGVRYGGKAGENTFYRAYVKYFNRDSLVFANGRDANDDWQMGQTGFRLDSYLDDRNTLTAQGDVYYGELGVPGDDTIVGGGNVLSRWTHSFSEERQLTVQAYYDRVQREIPGTFEEDRDTYDLDAQYRFPVGWRHDFVIGLNYRLSSDTIDNPNPTVLAFIPEKRNFQIINGFIQDTITLWPERVGLTLGSKFEHNDYTGFEVQPTARLAWTPTRRQTVWAAVSRAVRIPARIDRDFVVPPVIAVDRDRPFESEELIAYELGYRFRPHADVSVDLALFYHDYDDLRSQEPTPGGRVLRNELEGETYGAELTVQYQPREWWQLRLGYTHLQKDLRLKSGSADPTGGVGEGNDPRHILVLHSGFDLPANVHLDGIARYVSRLPNPRVPDYLELDVRLAWAPRPDLELAVVGQNLLDNQHPEFGAPTATRREVQRGVYGKVTWRF